jgi:hypothetical protein
VSGVLLLTAGEKKEKNPKKKKGFKSALHSGGMGVPKKGISEKGQNSGFRVGNPLGVFALRNPNFRGLHVADPYWAEYPPTPTAYVGEVPLIRYLRIGKESAGSPVLN